MKAFTDANAATTSREKTAPLPRNGKIMPIDIGDVMERAFEQAFLKALDRVIQGKTDALFAQALADGSPLAKTLEEKFAEGLNRFLQEGIRWEKKKPGFKK
jgi:hypothetical protein